MAARKPTDPPPTRPRPERGEAETIGRRASKVVEEAALILEEELAMGIGAARSAEQRLFGARGSGENPEALIERFRTDAHDVVDLALDLLGRTLSTVGTVADRTIRIRNGMGSQSGEAAPRRRSHDSVSTLVIPGQLSAGETAEVAMRVENDSSSPTDVFELKASDLLSDEGSRIPARNVGFEPETVKIAPHDAEKITVKLRVPATVKPGTYSGLLQATKLKPVRAVLIATIA